MKGFKTVIFGVLLVLISVLSNADMQEFIAENIPSIGTSIGTIIIILRAVSNSSIFKKE